MSHMHLMPRKRLEEIRVRHMGKNSSNGARGLAGMGGRMRQMQIDLILEYLPRMDDETKARAESTLKQLRGTA